MNPTENEQKLDGLVVGLALERFGGDVSRWWALSVEEQVDIFARLEVDADPRKRPGRRGASRDPSPAELEQLRQRALQGVR